MLVSIVVPAFNEAPAITAYLEQVLAHCAAKQWQAEVLVVDDGSEDDTAACVERVAQRHEQVRLLQLPHNRGKGHAVRTGVLAARGDVRGFTDADGSTPIQEFDRALAEIERGADVVIGSRAKKDANARLDTKLHRRVMGRAFNALLRLFIDLRDGDGTPIADSQCGFKWFTAAAAESLFSRAVVDGFAFDVEVLYLANQQKLRVVELPVSWADHGRSSVNLWVEPWRMLRWSMRIPRLHRGDGSAAAGYDRPGGRRATDAP